MKRLFILAICLMQRLFAMGSTRCFLAKEKEEVLKQEGDCSTRRSPRCTFNIALSLIGFEAEILLDETHPEFPYVKGYTDKSEKWKQPHNPTSWMKNSCVWYSQVLAQEMGMRTLKSFVQKFEYGNQDVAGDPGQLNGLKTSWINSSLKISPEEQVIFLRKFLDRKLPVESKSIEMTRKILLVDHLSRG